MNCRDVEPFLDQLSTSSIDEDLRDEAAMREHLATCTACQQAVRTLARWDDQLTRAMNDIDVPPGLSQRLMLTLGQASPVDPILKPAMADPIPRKAWPRTLAALTIVCLLSVAIWGTWQLLRPPILSTTDIAALLQQSAENPTENLQAFENSGPRLPKQWLSLNGKIVTFGWKQVELSNLRLNVAAVPFGVRVKRGQPVLGTLFVVPKSRWTPTPAVPVSRVPIQYAPPYAWIVWPEKEFVYILSVNGSVPELEHLQRLLGGNQSVL